MYGIVINGRFRPTFCKDEYAMCNGFTSYKVYSRKYTLDNKMKNTGMIC